MPCICRCTDLERQLARAKDAAAQQQQAAEAAAAAVVSPRVAAEHQQLLIQLRAAEERAANADAVALEAQQRAAEAAEHGEVRGVQVWRGWLSRVEAPGCARRVPPMGRGVAALLPPVA